MRALYITLFLAVLSTSLAVKNTNQQKSLDINRLKLESTNFLGSAIQGLLQVTDIAETQQVITIIEEVRDELRKLLGETQTNYDNEKETYGNNHKRYEEVIQGLESSILNTEVAKTQAENSRTELIAGIDATTTIMTNAQKAYTDEVDRRGKAAAAHDAKITDLREAVEACEEALRLMEEVKTKDLPARSANFLQTSEQMMKNHINKINEKLSHISLKNTITPMLKTLVEITQEGVNWDAIINIIRLIEELKASLLEEIRVSIEEDAADATYSAQVLESSQKTINDSKKAIEQKQEALNTEEEKIRTYTSTLQTLRTSLGENQTNLAALESEWATKSANYDDALERLRKDIEVLEIALEYLHAQSD